MELLSFRSEFCSLISAMRKNASALEQISLGQLDTNLRRCYAYRPEIYQEMSTDSKSILFGFGHGIERYLNGPPLQRPEALLRPKFKKIQRDVECELPGVCNHQLQHARQCKHHYEHRNPISGIWLLLSQDFYEHLIRFALRWTRLNFLAQTWTKCGVFLTSQHQLLFFFTMCCENFVLNHK